MPIKVIAKSVLPAIPNSPIANVISKVSQGREAGNNSSSNDCLVIVNSGTPSDKETTTYDLRVVSPHFYPSISIPTLNGSASKSVMQSLEELYNTLMGSAYDTPNFNRADLGKHIIIGEGFLCGLDMIDRYIDTFNIKQYGNTGPDIFCQGQGFKRTHAGAKVDFAELIAARNLLVPLINKLLIPSSIPWLQKHRYLVRHVFADDLHLKTGFVIPVLECLYTRLISGQNDVGLMLPTYYDPRSYQNDIIDFANSLYSHLTDYIDSAFFKDISPYLWRAMLQPNGPKVDKPYSVSERKEITPISDYEVVFDYRIIQMIRNADYIGIPFNLCSGNDGNMNIHEDSSSNLVQGMCYNNSNNTINGVILKPFLLLAPHSATISIQLSSMTFQQYALNSNHWWNEEIIPYASQKRLVNLENWPSSDETLFYVMNCKVMADQYPTGDTGTACWKLWSTGDTVFTTLATFQRDTADVSFDNIEYRELVPFKINYIYGTNTLQLSKNNLALINYQYNDYYTQINLTAYLCCPTFTHVTLRNTSPLIRIESQYIDKDNLVELAGDAIDKAHGFTLYTSFLLHGSKSEKKVDKEAQSK